MNFRTALHDLYSGDRDITDLAKRHNLSSDQLTALRAISAKLGDSARFSGSSAFIASMMA